MLSELVLQVFLTLVLVVVAVICWSLYPYIIEPLRSSLLDLPGPPTSSWLLGSLQAIYDSDGELICDEWVEQYGRTFMYRGFFSMPRLFTTDTRALHHVLTHSADYQKPEQARRSLSSLAGKGLLLTEGDHHRQQRRVCNPAFGPANIRGFTDILINKSLELREVWSTEISHDGHDFARIDVLKDLGKMALDVIGLAGFNYSFDSLNPDGKPNELARAFQEIFSVPDRVPILMMLQYFFPVFGLVRDARMRRVEEAQRVMLRIGSDLIAEKKALINNEHISADDVRRKDLLTLLIKSNMSKDIPEHQRLSDEDVLAQVPTFLVTGHETSSTATTWCLYALSQSSRIQNKLRQELQTLPTDTPTMDELMSLPYLDMVVRETLRLYAPVPTTMRVATKDDVIPLSEPIIGRNGKPIDKITVNAGSHIVVPIATLNRLPALWGDDALEFRPERWECPPEAISSIPGVWGNMLTFLGGPRACVGYRFSLVEMKALVFTLLRAFTFELAVPVSEIQRKTAIVQRPLLSKAPEEGSQLPLLVRPIGAC